MRVALLHNAMTSTADASELDVLEQLRLVQGALAELGHSHACFPVTRAVGPLLTSLTSFSPDVVFNLVESVAGRAELHPCVPALLDLGGLPYTGASFLSLGLTTDKVVAKKIMVGDHIPTPPFFSCPPLPQNIELPGPWIVKPALEDASIGIDSDSVFFDRSDLLAALPGKCRQFPGQPLLVERYIEGREFNIALLARTDEVQVLGPVEMLFADFPEGMPRIVGYRAKWDPSAFEFHHTVRRFEFPDTDRALLDRLREVARQCWRCFNLRGYARVDVRVDEKGQPWVLEINGNPCLSPDAGFLAAAGHDGISSAQVIARILADAVQS